MSKQTFARIRIRLAQPKDLLEHLYPNGKLGGLAFEGPPPVAVGRRCRLELEFDEPARRHFTVQGVLAWARHKGSALLRESYGVDFVPDDESGRDRLLRLARAELPPDRTRFDHRVAASLPVRLGTATEWREESLADLSQGGAFVRTDRPLPVDTPVGMEIRPPRSLRKLRLKGRVAWVRTSGAVVGMGIEFIYDDARQAERVRKAIAALEANADE